MAKNAKQQAAMSMKAKGNKPKMAKGGLSTDSTKFYNKAAVNAARLSKDFEKKGDVKGSKMAMDVMEYQLKNADRQKFKNKPGYDKMGNPVKKRMGGSLKSVDTSKNPGLAKLPTAVRNKMGYAKKGGSTKMK